MKKYIGLFIYVALLFYVATSIKCYTVSGESMEPVLYDGDVVIAVKYKNPQRGDIVTTFVKGYPIVKTVVAIGGDKVVLDKNEIKLNDVLLTETKKSYKKEEIDVVNGTVFLLGNNVDNSADSRDFGLFYSTGLYKVIASANSESDFWKLFSIFAGVTLAILCTYFDLFSYKEILDIWNWLLERDKRLRE